MVIFGEKINFSDEIFPHFVWEKKLTGIIRKIRSASPKSPSDFPNVSQIFLRGSAREKLLIIPALNKIQRADYCFFAITSNGRTVFEIAAMKIPMIAIAVNKRERLHSFVRYSKCGFHIDMHSKQDYSIVIRKISNMLDYENREKFVKNLHDVELLNGINKVKELIYKKLS